jgi:predicted Kef-type K+ transport protein
MAAADAVIFRDLAYVFVAAVLGGALAWWVRQPLILGYVLGGIIIGPFTPALLVGIGLTQIGEFSFILVQVARAAGHVGDEVYNAALAASLVTIVINSVLVRWAPSWVPSTPARAATESPCA